MVWALIIETCIVSSFPNLIFLCLQILKRELSWTNTNYLPQTIIKCIPRTNHLLKISKVGEPPLNIMSKSALKEKVVNSLCVCHAQTTKWGRMNSSLGKDTISWNITMINPSKEKVIWENGALVPHYSAPFDIQISSHHMLISILVREMTILIREPNQEVITFLKDGDILSHVGNERESNQKVIWICQLIILNESAHHNFKIV